MRRKVLFAVAAVVLASGVMVIGLLGADLLLHRRAERSAGLNIWGYRGPTVPRRHPGEPRVAVLGGSTAFGYGVTWDNAFPTALERALKASAPGRQWSVVNLGYNNEGAYSFRFTLEDFVYLEPDVVVLYEGYNDMIGDDGPNTSLFRHDSPVFLLTGYMPILPLIFNEKALALRHGGDLDAAYADAQGHGKVVFRPNLAARATATTLEAAVVLEQSIESQLRRFSSTPAHAAGAGAGTDGCGDPWRHYCESVAVAVDYALSRNQKVIVAGQPSLASEHLRTRQEDQQRALAELLRRRFAGNSGVRYVNLAQAVDLSDHAAAPDGMHLNAGANQSLAQQLVAPVLDILGTPHSAPGDADSRR
jgi:lysophospholipase L1-like esterase